VNRWSVSLTGRAFADGEFNNTNGMYVVCTADCPPVTVGHPTINFNSIPGRFYVDANITYGFEFAEGSTADVFLSVKNALNEQPPPLPASANLAALYDTLGVVYRAGIRIRL
jgi:hypothetical protein